jgi:REP element-mobilizing transposase RayT
VAHTARCEHKARHPVHVTLRVRRGLPSLRGFDLAQALGATFRGTVGRHEHFRVVHFSIQGNHLHLIVEAEHRKALSRGMQGLASMLAKNVNRRLGRKGSLFSDRYHEHVLTTPTEVRHAIAYVLQNVRKHGEIAGGIDNLSSARWFDGWRDPPPAPTTPSPVAPATKWLLREGWKKPKGLLGRSEGPTAA